MRSHTTTNYTPVQRAAYLAAWDKTPAHQARTFAKQNGAKSR
jgi:hypothetical protein